MKKATFTVVILILLSASYVTIMRLPESVMAATIYVGGVGPGNYTSIQDAINDSNPGDTIYVYNGTYNEFLTISKTLSIFGEEANKTVIVIDRGIDVVYISADWVNISRFTIMNTNYRTDGGIFLDHVRNCTISNNTVAASGHGIVLHYSDNNTILQNEISNNYRAGIYLQNSVNNTILDNKMENNGIVIAGQLPIYWSSHSIDISNNVNGKPVYYWKNLAWSTIPPGAGQVILFNCTGVTVEGQNLTNASGGVQVAYSPNTTILDSNVSNNRLIGILLWQSDNSTIFNSIVYGNNPGIHLDHSNNTSVESNTIKGGLYGIYLEGTDENKLANNSVSFCGSGIYLSQSHNNTLTNNTASWNSEYGIVAGLSNNSTYADNSVWENQLEGIRIGGASNTIARNTAFSNRWGGISLWGSDNTTIHNASVSDNFYGFSLWNSDGNTLVNNTAFSNRERGIVLGGSTNNSIYHNSFIDNPTQASDDNNTNRWDSGYPSGGNYWSDYAGLDEFYGPNQDQPGCDGIGDTEYDILGGVNTDRYPLMSPFEMIHPLPPTGLQAILTGDNLENVTLSWALSQDDGKVFKSVTGYRIYRNTTYAQGGLGYVNIASVPNGTSEFIDNLAGEGNPDNYFYLVCAVDIDNESKCVGNQAAKFTRSLSEGLNLASVPLVQYDESFSTVLQTLSSDAVWSFDSVNQEWKSFVKSKPYGQSLEYVNHTLGIWVNVTQDSNLTVAGIVPIHTAIHLRRGWNLVGFPSFQQDYTIADLRADVIGERVEGFEASAPPYLLRLMSDGDILQTGYGYWVKVADETIWNVANS